MATADILRIDLVSLVFLLRYSLFLSIESHRKVQFGVSLFSQSRSEETPNKHIQEEYYRRPTLINDENIVDNKWEFGYM